GSGVRRSPRPAGGRPARRGLECRRACRADTRCRATCRSGTATSWAGATPIACGSASPTGWMPRARGSASGDSGGASARG
ncbi:hypothetical protein HK405_000528, partial [Cladochytrium tenue]